MDRSMAEYANTKRFSSCWEINVYRSSFVILSGSIARTYLWLQCIKNTYNAEPLQSKVRSGYTAEEDDMGRSIYIDFSTWWKHFGLGILSHTFIHFNPTLILIKFYPYLAYIAIDKACIVHAKRLAENFCIIMFSVFGGCYLVSTVLLVLRKSLLHFSSNRLDTGLQAETVGK